MDAYKIAVTLALSSNSGQFLSGLSSMFTGIHQNINQLQQKFQGLRGFIISAMTFKGGELGLEAVFKGITKGSEDISDAIVKLKTLGPNVTAAIPDLQNQAYAIASKVPMTVPEILKIPAEIYGLTQDKGRSLEETKQLMLPLAQLETVLKLHGQSAGGDDLRKILKAGEVAGLTTTGGKFDLNKTIEYLDMAVKAINATGGMVNASQIFNQASTAGATLKAMTPEGFFAQMMASQVMGGYRAGTSYMAMFRQLTGGQMTKKVAEEMTRMGVLKPGDYTQTGKGAAAGIKVTPQASARLMEEFGQNPLDFARVLREKLIEHGYTTDKQQLAEIGRLSGRNTTFRFTAEMVSNYQQMLLEIEKARQALGLKGSFDTIMGDSVKANITAVKDAWTNLLTAVAGPNSENLIAILKNLTAAINYFTGVIRSADPGKIRILTEALTAFFGVLAVGGVLGMTVNMIRMLVSLGGSTGLAAAGATRLVGLLGPGGILIGAIAGLGLAAAVYGPSISKWLHDQFPDAMKKAKEAIERFGQNLKINEPPRRVPLAQGPMPGMAGAPLGTAGIHGLAGGPAGAAQGVSLLQRLSDLYHYIDERGPTMEGIVSRLKAPFEWIDKNGPTLSGSIAAIEGSFGKLRDYLANDPFGIVARQAEWAKQFGQFAADIKKDFDAIAHVFGGAWVTMLSVVPARLDALGKSIEDLWNKLTGLFKGGPKAPLPDPFDKNGNPKMGNMSFLGGGQFLPISFNERPERPDMGVAKPVFSEPPVRPDMGVAKPLFSDNDFASAFKFLGLMSGWAAIIGAIRSMNNIPSIPGGAAIEAPNAERGSRRNVLDPYLMEMDRLFGAHGKLFTPGAGFMPAPATRAPLDPSIFHTRPIEFTPSQANNATAAPSLIPAVNWQPPDMVAQPVQVPITLNLDGRTLAESVSERLAELMMFPRSAPYAGADRGWTPPDTGWTTT